MKIFNNIRQAHLRWYVIFRITSVYLYARCERFRNYIKIFMLHNTVFGKRIYHVCNVCNVWHKFISWIVVSVVFLWFCNANDCISGASHVFLPFRSNNVFNLVHFGSKQTIEYLKVLVSDSYLEPELYCTRSPKVLSQVLKWNHFLWYFLLQITLVDVQVENL